MPKTYQQNPQQQSRGAIFTQTELTGAAGTFAFTDVATLTPLANAINITGYTQFWWIGTTTATAGTITFAWYQVGADGATTLNAESQGTIDAVLGVGGVQAFWGNGRVTLSLPLVGFVRFSFRCNTAAATGTVTGSLIARYA